MTAGKPPTWYVYVLECLDASLYTGIAIDVARRYASHAVGKGGRYTRSHPPKRVLSVMPFPDRSSASREEYRIKQLPLPEKRALCARYPAPSLHVLASRPRVKPTAAG